jgi:predicted  nucleic acid-binding Zn-ribbon protein
VEGLNRTVTSLTQQIVGLEAMLQERSTEALKLRDELLSVHSQRHEIGQAFDAASAKASALADELMSARERTTDFESVLTSNLLEIARLRTRLDVNQYEQFAAADQELRRLTGEVEEREQRLVAADQELRRIMNELGDRERRLHDIEISRSWRAIGGIRRLLFR